MADKRADAGVRFPPPLVFLGFVLLGPVIDRFFALPPVELPWPVGAAVLAAGLILLVLTNGAFARRRENPTPWSATTQIIDTGLYAWSRNPMYLGMAVAAAGLALLLHSWTSLALTGVAIGVIQRFVIRREEAYLLATFGDAYADYCRRVRRWI